jgi:hypothetical protein
MQYLLTQEEYDLLLTSRAERPSEKTLATIQELCTKVADHMPVKFWGRDEETPWGCILTKEDWYCDECPVQNLCPHKFKRWSK